jgi:hypothetical protein
MGAGAGYRLKLVWVTVTDAHMALSSAVSGTAGVGLLSCSDAVAGAG